jgi:hypothetical protein
MQLEMATGWKYECLARWTELNFSESKLVFLQSRAARARLDYRARAESVD